MKVNVATSPVDAQHSLREAQRLGQGDGTKNYPPYVQGEDHARDYRKATNDHEAVTTQSLSIGAHLQSTRPKDDDAVATWSTATTAATSDTADRREAVTQSRSKRVGYETALPINALTRALPKWLAHLLTILIGIASGAATIASLQGVTEDSPQLSYAIGVGVAIATVVGAAALGRMLRERDLNDIKGEHYGATSKRSTLVMFAGVLGVVCIGLGVAQLRGKASEADAERRAEDTRVVASGPSTVADTAVPGSHSSDPVSVPWSIWLLLEAGLLAAALTVEYLASNARLEERDRLRTIEDDCEVEYGRQKKVLQSTAGHLASAMACRADRDAAILLTGDAQLQWALTKTAQYRGSNLSARGTGGDPFPDDEVIDIKVSALFTGAYRTVADGFVGSDIDVLVNGPNANALERVGNPDPADPRHVLRQAFIELALSPDHPELGKATAPPLPGDEAVLDPAAKAKAAALGSRHGRSGSPPTRPLDVTHERVSGNGYSKEEVPGAAT